MNAEFKQAEFRSPSIDRAEFELACIREFSHSGHHLGVGVSPAERRERIRAAILREHKSQWAWRDSGVTYAEAFRYAYHEPLGEDGAEKIPFEHELSNFGVDRDTELEEEGDDSEG